MSEQDPNVQGTVQETGIQDPTPYVTAEVAWEMAKKAAAEAREDALKDINSKIQYVDNEENRDVGNNRQYQDNRKQDARPRRDDRYDDYDDRRSRKRRDDYDNGEESEDLIGFSPRLVKQLQTTVGVFNTLKDFASNPMQKAIEDRIGGLAAGIIEQAFTAPRGPPPKRDVIDQVLNSQMAFGLGQGLGSRAPELIESLSKSFGKEKAEHLIEGMIGKYSGGDQRRSEPSEMDRSQNTRQSPSSSAQSSRQSTQPNQSSQQNQSNQSNENIELLLSLDPNNPEHIAAYAESQGGISIDVARKMLMIHQDDIINRMESQGANTANIRSQRGSRIGQENPQDMRNMPQNEHIHSHNPQQQVIYPPKVTPSQQASGMTAGHDISPEDMTTINDFESSQIGQQDIRDNTQYTEYKDLEQREKNNINRTHQNQGVSGDQQIQMMKSFTEDIGKVMGDVIGKIESLNNTVFNLQNELNEVKRKSHQPTRTSEDIDVSTQRSIQPNERSQYTSTKDFFSDDFERELEDEIRPGIQDNSRGIERSHESHMSVPDIFHEKTQNIHDFERELEEETKRAVKVINKEENTIDIIQDTDKIEDSDTIDRTKDTLKINDKESISKKPMSMVNKKKIGYSPRQKKKTKDEQIKDEQIEDEQIKDEKDKDVQNVKEIYTENDDIQEIDTKGEDII